MYKFEEIYAKTDNRDGVVFDNASLAVAMARGIKATLLCAHGPTVLTNPEPCSASRS